MLESKASRLPLHNRGTAANVLAGAGAGLVLASFSMIKATTPFPGPAALPSVIGGALLVATGGSWINRRLLSWPAVVFIGRISYSWYLWHWPLLALLRMFGGDIPPLSWGLGASLVSFGLAVSSYYLVERPFRASKSAPVPLLCRYAMVSLALVGVSVLIYRTNGIEKRSPVMASIERIKQSRQSDPCAADDGETVPNLSSSCVGAAASDNKVALWGDSHAEAIASVLRARTLEQGYVMEEFVKLRCPPLLGAARNGSTHPQHIQQCIAYNDNVLRTLVADDTVKVVMLEASWGVSFNPLENRDQLVPAGGQVLTTSSQARSALVLETSLRKTLESLRASGKQVVVFGDFPFFEVNPVWRLRTRGNATRQRLFYFLRGSSDSSDPGSDQVRDNTPDGRRARQLLMQTATSVPGVTYWDPRKRLCISEDTCLYRDGDVPYFVDDNHVTPQGAMKGLEGWSLPKAQ